MVAQEVGAVEEDDWVLDTILALVINFMLLGTWTHLAPGSCLWPSAQTPQWAWEEV